MDTLNLHIYKLDDEIIELLSIRQELMTNSKNFKVMELGGYNMKDNFISKLDHNIFNYEVKFENKKNRKLFNENLDNSNEDYETLNLNRMIKYSYIRLEESICVY